MLNQAKLFKFVGHRPKNTRAKPADVARVRFHRKIPVMNFYNCQTSIEGYVMTNVIRKYLYGTLYCPVTYV